jgi:hypothetical protein
VSKEGRRQGKEKEEKFRRKGREKKTKLRWKEERKERGLEIKIGAGNSFWDGCCQQSDFLWWAGSERCKPRAWANILGGKTIFHNLKVEHCLELSLTCRPSGGVPMQY